MQTKTIAIAVIVIAVVVSGFILFSNGNGQPGTQDSGNVSMQDGKQVITIDAKGGYSPKITNAKAGVPTIIKLNTQGTFDCSSAISIPSLGYRNNLPAS